MSNLPDLSRVNGFEYKSGELVLSPNSPMISARRLLADRYTTPTGDQLLFRHRGIFYCWQSSYYKTVPTDYLKADINLFLECAYRQSEDDEGKRTIVPFHPKRAHVNEVVASLESVSFLGESLNPPMWLGDETPDLAASEIIACENGLLHLPTRSILPHTPLFFSHTALDYPFDDNASEPTQWLGFLNDLFGSDQASIDTLQEIFGYCLVADNSHQKAFMIIGPKRSGKGTIARILESVIGAANVVAPTLTGLSTNFGMQPLIGKRVAIIGDARISGKVDTAVISEHILSVTGEDLVTIDRKNREAWTGKLDTKFVLISNELPRLADASGALASRFIILLLTRSFYNNEDRGLYNKLTKERSGILKWAIEGFERLYGRGYFIQPEAGAEAVRDIEDLGAPVGAFVRDRCIVDITAPNLIVLVDDLYDAFTAWCSAQGRGMVSTKQIFGRDLRAVVPGLKMAQPREFNQKRCYQGIVLDNYA